MTPWPYVDPASCSDDPDRKGWRLCPRCSTTEVPCCNITPEPLSTHRPGGIFTQAEILERQSAGKFPTEEDYMKYKWVCEGWCDQYGRHTS